jgi:hypothetical protein
MAITQVRTKQQVLVTDNLSFQNSYKITNLVDPTSAQDAATKAYVDAVKTGLDFKDSARVATTGAETYTIVGGAVTTISGLTVDGVTLAVNDRILIKNAPSGSGAGAGAGTANTTQPANGIYIVTANTTNLTVARSIDADSNTEVTSGMFVFVSEGTANADNGYVLITNDAIVVNTTGLTYTQFSGAGQITAGAGLTKTGNTIDAVGTADRITVNADSIDIASTYAGQTSIITLGTVTTGTWNATTIATTRGGTGLTSYAQGDLIYASASNTLTTLAKSSTANQFLKNSGTTNNPAWASISVSDIGGGAALTKTDDTNVTLTLGGTPTSALLAAVSLTLGWTGSLAPARGGTGITSYAIGDLIYASGTTTLAKLAAVAAGSYLRSAGTGTAPVWSTVTIPNAATIGDIWYGSASNAVSSLAGNTTTTKQFLSQTGTGAASAAPAWATISGSDITGAALTKTDDTNVTLTLGGTPATALLRAASITVGWTGQLAVGRGGTGAASFTAYMPVVGGTTTTGALQSVSAGSATGQPLTYQGASAIPTFAALNLAGASVVTGTLPIGNGGTGVSTTPSNGQLLIGNGSGFTLASLTAGANISITPSAGGITIAATGSSSFTASNIVVREVPTGTINGSNVTFGLAQTPVSGKEMVFVNGVLQNVGSGNDYTISGATITFTAGATPQTGDVVLVTYVV